MAEPKRVIKISVTDKHIEAGERHNEQRCPVALACRDADTEIKYCKVFETTAHIGEAEDNYTRYSLEVRLSQFIRCFDRGMRVLPMDGAIYLYDPISHDLEC